MKLKEVNKNLIEQFFANIQTLEYKTIKNGQETIVIAEIYKTESTTGTSCSTRTCKNEFNFVCSNGRWK